MAYNEVSKNIPQTIAEVLVVLFHHQVKRDESGAIHVTKQKHLHLYYDLINFTVSIQINYPHLLHVIVLRPWCVKAIRISAMNHAFRII